MGLAKPVAQLADLRDALRGIVQGRMALDPAHDMAHLDRVWHNVQQISGAEKTGDLTILLAASYLHDLVNLPKDDPDRAKASLQSARAAGPILEGLGFTRQQIATTRHAIAAHSFSAGIRPETPEAEILRDADRLDALGAIGIARTFVVAGALGLTLYESDDPFGQRRPLEDSRFSIDHWRVKLLKLPDGMLTATGRRIARHRAGVMIAYLKELSAEIGADLPPGLSGSTE